MTAPETPAKPPVVSEAEWAAANAAQVEREKAQMKANDAVLAGRRHLPMVKMDPTYAFEGPSGPLTFAELFDGRPQLILYHFMLRPGSDHICPGCAMYTDNLPHLSHVRERDITFVLGSRVPQDHIRRVQEQMGWQHIPWVSTEDRFAEDIGALVGGSTTFRYTVFLRDGDDIYKTYATAGRGAETVGGSAGLIDSTPYGRQEDWQDVPEGFPQGPPYTRGALHTDYDDQIRLGGIR
ncbi:MAG: DUF899 family protein [Solirubrobacteraceae bacterium]|nr:DUF899 family protein [Solirubrobacteraceae bacterium]